MGTIVNIYIVYDPTLKNCLFGAVTLTEKADIDKFRCSGYRIGFDRRSSFSFQDSGFGQNVWVFGTDISSSTHIDNKKKDQGPTQGLQRTLTAENFFSIDVTITKINFA